jgi:ABC-2 type transport system ATP-binding protein
MIDTKKSNHCAPQPCCHLTAKNFSVGFNNSFTLSIPELDIPGNVIAVLGHNGAGKSTLIKSILNLLPSTKGSLEILTNTNGAKTTLIPERDMIFCPENGSVFSDISVESYIRLWCRIKYSDANYYKKQGQYYCELLNLSPLFSKLGRELSKGQRRRVQTAICFLMNPKLVLFDEPFEGLDVQKSHALTEIISEHAKKMFFIISSHRMDVIERLANAVVVLKEGRIVASGSIAEVCSHIAGHSVSISCLNDGEQIVSTLKEKFPKSLVVKIGKDITITGKDIDANSVLASLNGSVNVNIPPRISQPNLIDAMNYHLSACK